VAWDEQRSWKKYKDSFDNCVKDSILSPASSHHQHGSVVRIETMKLSGLAIASLLSGAALAAPAAAPDASLISDDASSDWALFKRQSAAIKRGRTDNLLFRTTLGGFIQYRNAKNPSWLTWSSNGCNYSPDNPRGYPFLQACQRHDFGYRNYKNQKRFTSANRKKIDDKFHDEYVSLPPPNFHNTSK